MGPGPGLAYGQPPDGRRLSATEDLLAAGLGERGCICTAVGADLPRLVPQHGHPVLIWAGWPFPPNVLEVLTVIGDQLDNVGPWFQAGAGQAPGAGQLPEHALLLQVPSCRPHDPLLRWSVVRL